MSDVGSPGEAARPGEWPKPDLTIVPPTATDVPPPAPEPPEAAGAGAGSDSEPIRGIAPPPVAGYVGPGGGLPDMDLEDPKSLAGLERDWWKELLAWRRKKDGTGEEIWPSESLDRLATSDLDGGRAVYQRYAGWITHSGDDKVSIWRVWNGRVHMKDHSGVVKQIAFTYADAYDRALKALVVEFEAPAELEMRSHISAGMAPAEARKIFETRKKEWQGWLRKQIAYGEKIRNKNGLDGIHTVLKTLCAVDESDFDRSPDYIVMGNGVFDLQVVKRTGRLELFPHSMSRKVTQCTEVQWLGLDAKCEWFEWYLNRSLPSAALRWYLQKWMGAFLLGGPKEKALLNFIGDSDSGKTVMLNVMKNVWGDYVHSVPVEIFLASKFKDQFAKNELRGKRLVTAVEPGSGKSMDDSVVKELTGGDHVTSRSPFQPFSSWRPQCLIAISSNQVMRLDTSDQAMMRRLRPIEFAVSFSDKPGTPPELMMDKGLEEKIRSELPGVAAWCMKGLLGYLSEGIEEPGEVTEKRERMAEEMDSTLEWLAAALEEGVVRELTDGELVGMSMKDRLQVGEAHEVYEAWCVSARSIRADRVQQRPTFSRVLARKYGKPKKSTGGIMLILGLTKGPAWVDPSVPATHGTWPRRV
jgi:P4 family phage/plasmid primase-like protien